MIAHGSQVQEVVTVRAIGGALILFLVLIRDGLPAASIAYPATVLILDLGSDGLLNSKLRLLVHAFTLVVPLAIRLARQRTTTLLPELAVGAITGSWYSAYALSIYPFAI
jgi:ABC-type glycerol-3-phosphate transport system permease component